MRSLLLAALFSLVAAASFAQLTVPAPSDVAAPPADAAKTSSGLASKVIKPGKGAEHPKENDLLLVNWTGWTADGKMFSTSFGRGVQTVDLGKMIAGWKEGVQLMVPGETRRFWIPEALAFKGKDPKGMVVYDIELIQAMPNSKPGGNQ